TRTQTLTVSFLNDGTYTTGIYTLSLHDALPISTISDSQGVGTIKDDGTGGTATDDDRPVYTVSDITRNEADGTATFTVTLTGDTALTSTVSYATTDNTATAAEDYTATNGTLTFA